MRPISIRLKGFKGFRAGLGLEEVSIDFTGLPDGLIAIVGQNGMGKTTLLDNLHPYRIMPYKLRESKEWSPGSFCFYDQCYGRDAMKEFAFELSGHCYKSVILIDADRRKQEAYLYRQEDDGTWSNYNSSVKDGKTGAYDQAIEELVGSPSLFFSSVFRSQDARKLSSYPRSEILGIICELLHVDHIKEQGEKAAKVVTALGNLVDDLERQKTPIHALLATRNVLGDQRDQIANSIELHEAGIKNLKAVLSKTEQQIRELELSNAAQALTRKRLEELRCRQAALQSDVQLQEAALQAGAADHNEEMLRNDAAIAQNIAELQRDIDAFTVEEQQEHAAAENELMAIAIKQQAVESILAQENEIRQAVSRVSDLEKELAADRSQLETLKASQGVLEANISGLNSTVASIDNNIRQDLNDLRQDSESLAMEEKREKEGVKTELVAIATKKQSSQNVLVRANDINQAVAREKLLTDQLSADLPRLEKMRADGSNLRIRLAELASVENEIQSAQSRLDDLRRLTDGLKGLDCHEDGKQIVNKSCKLLVSAVEAERQIPLVELEMEALRAKLAETETLLHQLEKLTIEGTALAAKVKSAENDLPEVRRTALLATDLTNAAGRVKELSEQETSLQARLDQRLADIARRLQIAVDRSQMRQSDLKAQKNEMAIKLAETQAQLSKNSEVMEFFAMQIAEAEFDLETTRQVATLMPELAGASARITELADQNAAVKTRLAQRTADIARKSAEATVRSQERQRALAAHKQELVRKWTVAEQNLAAKLAALIKETELTAEECRKMEATLNGDVDNEIASLNEIIAAHQTNIAVEESILKELHAGEGNINGKLADLKTKEAELELMDAEIIKINDEMTNWRILAKACSNDGIVALELDDAGPAIASVANDLLHACYGPRFSVRLETQGMKADGGLKEIFDITVFDAERDEEKSIRDMSGGEVTYIEDALTRAFCLYNLNRSDRNYGTLYADEKDGALDADRKHEFLAIKRQALIIGAHEREFFITQTPELYEAADARIMLSPGCVNLA